MHNDKIHIVLASDENYRPGLEVTKATMIASCSVPERLVFHVFDEAAIEKCGVADMPKWNTSHMPYLRLWLPTLLPDVDWVVYSDVDTIWNRDVCALWDLGPRGAARTDGYLAVAWVRDMPSMRSESSEWIGRVAAGEGFEFDWARYGCSGICVMNLRKMREMKFTERVLELYAKYGVPKFPDQDVLNVIFNHDCELLPSVWNTMGDWSQLPKSGERCVYHLTGVGRHFHDASPPTYPPQYQLWWNMRNGTQDVHWRSRILAAGWPLHVLMGLMPLGLCERIVRQWYFAKVLCRHAKTTSDEPIWYNTNDD